MTLPCTLAVADAEVPYRVRLRDVHEPEVRVDVTLDAVVLLQDRIQQYVVSTLPGRLRLRPGDLWSRR